MSDEISRRDFLLGWIKKIKNNIQELTDLPDLLNRIDKIINRQKYEEAKKILQNLCKKYPNSIELKRRLAITSYKSKDKEKAYLLFKELATQKDNLSFLYLAIIKGEENDEKTTLFYLKKFFDPENIILQREINLNIALYESKEISFKELVNNIKKLLS